MASTPYFTIALPVGRLADESLHFFKRSKIANIVIDKKDRKLDYVDTDANIRILLARAQDIPTYILQGGAHAGITGKDILLEGTYDITSPLYLNFGQCRFSLAAPKHKLEMIQEKRHLKVATKYPKLTTSYFYQKGKTCEIIKLNGSIELAPNFGLADCITDLVSTGQTLKENNLVEIETIEDISSVLVIHRYAYALFPQKIRKFILALKSVNEESM